MASQIAYSLRKQKATNGTQRSLSVSTRSNDTQVTRTNPSRPARPSSYFASDDDASMHSALSSDEGHEEREYELENESEDESQDESKNESQDESQDESGEDDVISIPKYNIRLKVGSTLEQAFIDENDGETKLYKGTITAIGESRGVETFQIEFVDETLVTSVPNFIKEFEIGNIPLSKISYGEDTIEDVNDEAEAEHVEDSNEEDSSNEDYEESDDEDELIRPQQEATTVYGVKNNAYNESDNESDSDDDASVLSALEDESDDEDEASIGIVLSSDEGHEESESVLVTSVPRRSARLSTSFANGNDASIHSVSSNNVIYDEFYDLDSDDESQTEDFGDEEVPELVTRNLGPVRMLDLVLLQSVTPLPPGAPLKIPDHFNWITHPTLQYKQNSSEMGPWDRLVKGDHVSTGHINIGPFEKQAQLDFLHEMADCDAFSQFSADGLTLQRSKLDSKFYYKNGLNSIDCKTMNIACKYLPNLGKVCDAMQRKYDVVLRLRIKRTIAKIDKTGGTTVHWDPNDERMPFQWHFRIIFTFGNWIKLFGFTESRGREDPMHMIALTHGSFVVMDPVAAGCSNGTLGERNSDDPLHAATLLPKAAGAKEDPAMHTYVFDVKSNDPENFFKNATEVRDWFVNEGGGTAGLY